MPGPNEAIPSSRAKLFVLPADGGQPIPLGLVEDVSATKVIASENFQTVGDPVTPDNVSNIEQGRIRWGKVHLVNPDEMSKITPRIQKWTQFRSFNLLAIDPVTNDPIFLAVGCRPESVDLNFRGGAAARQNFQGLCRYVLTDSEVKQAAAA